MGTFKKSYFRISGIELGREILKNEFRKFSSLQSFLYEEAKLVSVLMFMASVSLGTVSQLLKFDS